MTLEFRILGSGFSGGVPRTDGAWGACDPAEPKNRRTRCSLLVRRRSAQGETAVIVDTSPDLREQCIAANLGRLDGVLLTHDHADQTHGIDDIRAFYLNQGQPIPVWMDEATNQSLGQKFWYIFNDQPGYPAICSAQALPAFGERVTLNGPGGEITVRTFDLDHGFMRAVGYRIGDVAYTPDVVAIPDESMAMLQGLDTWIVDALRWEPHMSHANVQQALDWIATVRPRRAILTNLHMSLDYNALRVKLPSGVEPGFDGLTFEV